MVKTKWLDRRIACPGPYITLCLSESEFDAALRHCKIKNCPNWVTDNADATTHHFANKTDDVVVVICIRDTSDRTPIEIAGLLIHESVHVWQTYCEMIGEMSPGREQEAYAIQAISQELMAEFARRIN
jgi:hypothetical protein